MVWKFDPETQTITMPDFTVVVVSDWDTQKTQIVAKFTECKMELVEKQEIIAEDISGEYHFTEPGGETANDIPAEFDMVLTAENDNNTSYKVTMDFGGDFKVLEFTGCSFDGDLLTIPYDKAYLNDEIFLFTGYIDEPWKSEIEFTTFGDNSLRMQNSLGFGVFDEKGDVPYPGGTILTLQKYWQNGVAVKQIEAADFSGTYVLESANFWPLKDCFDFKANFEMEIEYNEAGGRYYVVKLMGSDIMSLNYGGIPCTANGNELSMDITSSSRYFNFVMDVDFVNVLDADYIYDGDGGMEKNLTLTLFEDGTVTMSDFTIWHKVEGDGEMAAFYSGITGIKKGVDVASVSAKEEAAVYVQNGVIYVKGGNEVALEVYNVDGRKVFDGIAAQVQGLPKGMYIVKCGTAATKILL